MSSTLTTPSPDSAELASRIDRMHGRDRLGAIAFVVALWIVLLFVMAQIWSSIADGTIRTILIAAGGLVLIFNTASILAMLRFYAGDKAFIYGLDIKHLDEMRRQERI